ncbi:hypothetical protein P4K49_30720 [Bacillus cereus]|uniref:Uncharacterized protein n=2 Tax=Bacillus cereus group TaxID=86661 RepID=A0A9X6VEZ0_BACTU|nr:MULTISPECIES: hypothetical protein [Bacillus cereus group]MCU5278217.1 hypothetical protein [Bacillus cereus]AMR85206.1 hypothetical protein A3L20_14655 [Bacillus thuringiensis]MBG9637676.1 hypothetical protein [Bacillus thuringiensis]MBG9637821.1 hypothetical protein [Bacillus thuringiensis]MBG9674901.1 hypothetical protein [Bacillus thuringiensis]
MSLFEDMKLARTIEQLKWSISRLEYEEEELLKRLELNRKHLRKKRKDLAKKINKYMEGN